MIYCIVLGKIIASINSQNCIIYHSTCDILLASNRRSVWCEQCANFRRSLYVQNMCLEKRAPNQTDPSSSVPYCALSSEEMSQRMKQLKQLIEDSVDTHGVILDDCLRNDFKQMVKECELQMEGATPSSFKWEFCQQQMDAASDSRGMRWHLRWCIYLRHQSTRLYANQNVYYCLLKRTLHDYTHNQPIDFQLK